VRAAVQRAHATGSAREPGPFEGGYLVPFSVHRELGEGWLYVAQERALDPLVKQALGMLGAQASNALYSSIAESMLHSQKGPVFDAMAV
jgi:hypothetical protein